MKLTPILLFVCLLSSSSADELPENAKKFYNGDWNAYKKSRPHDNDCSIYESKNWKGAQQCVESWECRGARMCERGGWCDGFDGCEGSPLPQEAPGLSSDHLAKKK